MFENNKYINSIVTNYWTFLYYFLYPFRFFMKKDETEEKNGGDLYEERCTVGGNRRKDKNEII